MRKTYSRSLVRSFPSWRSYIIALVPKYSIGFRVVQKYGPFRYLFSGRNITPVLYYICPQNHREDIRRDKIAMLESGQLCLVVSCDTKNQASLVPELAERSGTCFDHRLEEYRYRIQSIIFLCCVVLVYMAQVTEWRMGLFRLVPTLCHPVWWNILLNFGELHIKIAFHFTLSWCLDPVSSLFIVCLCALTLQSNKTIE